jgi:hypothetical protein
LDVTTEQGVSLVGQQYWPERIQPGDAIYVTLYWQAEKAKPDPFQVVLRADSPVDQTAWAQRDDVRPSSLAADWWQAGQIIPERFVLTTTEQIPVGAYRLTVSLQALRSERYAPLYQDGDKNALDRVTIGYTAVPWPGDISPAAPIQARFGDQIQLTAVNAPTTASPGDTVPVSLYWEALRRPADDYVVFIHLLNEAGEWVAGSDQKPFQGQYTTLAWLPGEIVPDNHNLLLPPDLSPGDYRLNVGLYQPESGQRLSTFDSTGNEQPDQSLPFAIISIP